MKLFIKTPIYAMSQERGPFKQKMLSWGALIEEHVCKCVMYGDSLPGDKYNHWIEDELATWLSDCNDVTFKPSNKKLKSAEYDKLLFGGLGDELSDARICLHNLQVHNSKHRNAYPFRQVDDEMVHKLYVLTAELREKFLPILSTRNSLSKRNIAALLHDILDPICLTS